MTILLLDWRPLHSPLPKSPWHIDERTHTANFRSRVVFKGPPWLIMYTVHCHVLKPKVLEQLFQAAYVYFPSNDPGCIHAGGSTPPQDCSFLGHVQIPVRSREPQARPQDIPHIAPPNRIVIRWLALAPQFTPLGAVQSSASARAHMPSWNGARRVID